MKNSQKARLAAPALFKRCFASSHAPPNTAGSAANSGSRQAIFSPDPSSRNTLDTLSHR